jgi:hypothetical protein
MGLFTRKFFQSVDEAKEFLIAKVVLEASLQGVPLNGHERLALNYASDEPSTGWDIDWDKVRGADDEGQEFERQMTDLLRSAFKKDKAADSAEAGKYRSALHMLAEETNWICYMAQQVLEPVHKTTIFGIPFES